MLLALACVSRPVHSDKFERLRTLILIFVQSSLWSMSNAIRALQKEIEDRALLWAAATIDDDDDDEIEGFVEGIPGYITPGTSKGALTMVDDLLLSR